MKFRMILSVLLLPAVAMAEQGTKPPASPTANQPYRVVAIQEPVAFAPMEGDNQDDAKSTDTKIKDVTKPSNTNSDDTKLKDTVILPADTRTLSYTLTGNNQYIPADNQSAYGHTPFGSSEVSKAYVDLNLRNAPLKEAVKHLNEQTKLNFVLEDDVPADARVTVVAKHIRLSTALDMLTDATDLHWGRRAEIKTGASKGIGSTYVIGKKVSSSYFQWSNDAFFNNPNILKDYKTAQPYKWAAPNDGNFRLYYQELLDKDGKPLQRQTLPNLNGSLNLDPNINYPQYQVKPDPKNPKGRLLLQPKLYSDLGANNYTLGNSLVTTKIQSETRSTFTCPHCKQQVTVIHKHQTPKCEKCGRIFHEDWDFCPFDGAKRPTTASNDWQFCPICGKSIKGEIKGDAKPEPKP